MNNAIVYLPPKYDTDKNKKYPVFYLLSGTTDTEEVYYKVGRVNYILDNLIAEGKAVEMIVVLPYGNPTKLLPPAPAPAGGFGGFGGGPGGFGGNQSSGSFSYLLSCQGLTSGSTYTVTIGSSSTSCKAATSYAGR